jgi:putative DNA methylase
MGIEKHFDVSFVAGLSLREKQIQQNYRPIIAVHKWFARRPGTLFRSLVLSEFRDKGLAEAFYSSNNLKGISVADPFMGGGTPLIEANRVGCDVIGYDINPMAYWIVRQEIEHLDLDAYRKAAHSLRRWLEKEVGHLYRTRCLKCDSPGAHVKYFLWIKTQTCRHCKSSIDLFPGYLIARDVRHPKNVFVCASCGHINEVEDREHPGNCRTCRKPLLLTGPAKRNRCNCPRCGTPNPYPDPSSGPPIHKMFAIEYHCNHCRPTHKGRFFKKPDNDDIAKFSEAVARWAKMKPRFVPEDEIPSGDETDRLHRWGYRRYREMFNPRQLLGLEISCRTIAKESEERIRNALATNLSDLLRYQNMLCRYDTMALKSLDVFSVHGFPVGLVRCESNLMGISKADGVNVGSGGWSNIVDKYLKAKAYCDQPFEVRYQGRRKIQVPIPDEWIGDRHDVASPNQRRKVQLHCQSATSAKLRSSSLDGVFTDPPYFGNVQYAELMDFCYVWLRRLVGLNQQAFKQASTRNRDELTGNVTMDRGLDHFTNGLSAVFRRMVHAMKPGAPLVFTYHHNRLEAYYPVAVAILDAGLTCSASFPCPAEMGASIHIGGTSSSIIDTIFVCRTTGSIPRRWLQDAPEGVAGLVEEDVQKLELGGVKPTSGDVRCILLGHLIRLAIWALRREWNGGLNTMERLAAVSQWIREFGGLSSVEKHLADVLFRRPRVRSATVREDVTPYEVRDAEVSF